MQLQVYIRSICHPKESINRFEKTKFSNLMALFGAQRLEWRYAEEKRGVNHHTHGRTPGDWALGC
ncbi:hypothetical protein D3C76_1790660 [compost metagenome]